MARYRGPKDRLSRREGVDLFGKGAKLTRLTVFPGQHGPKGQMRAQSQYGRQLRSKQAVKRMYGLLEKKFRMYVTEAGKQKKNTADALYALLESRLDNVVYRLGFAKTRNQARQLVGHRHIFVNGKKLNIPSYKAKKGDTITLSKTAMDMPVVKKLLEDEKIVIPSWLKRKAAAGMVNSMPKREEADADISFQDIIEFYSR